MTARLTILKAPARGANRAIIEAMPAEVAILEERLCAAAGNSGEPWSAFRQESQ